MRQIATAFAGLALLGAAVQVSWFMKPTPPYVAPSLTWTQGRIVATSDVHFYVSPSGRDSNDCLSPATACLSPSVPIGLVMNRYDLAGFTPYIHFAPGRHVASVQIEGQPLGFHAINFYGECGNPSAVTIQAPPGKPAFWVQDLAIGIIQCLTVTGDIGIAGRQHVVVDIANVVFGPSGIAISMTDQAVANLGGRNWISGNMVVFAAADYHSTIRCAVPMIITRPVQITYFISSQGDSIVVWENGCRFGNAHLVSGQQYVVQAGGVFRSNGIATPGNIAGVNAMGTGRVY